MTNRATSLSMRNLTAPESRASRSIPLARLLTYVVLIAIAIVEAFPLAWMIVTSVKDSHEVFNTRAAERNQLAEFSARLVRDEFSRSSRQLALCHGPHRRAGGRAGDARRLWFRALPVSRARAGVLHLHRHDDGPPAGDPHSDVSIPEVAASAQFADRTGAFLCRRRHGLRGLPDADILPQPAGRTRRRRADSMAATTFRCSGMSICRSPVPAWRAW